MAWFSTACSTLFTLENWPLLFISLGMIVAGVVDWWIFKVPNKLTLPLVLSGWLLGLWHSLDLYWFGWELRLDAGTGGIGSSLAGTAWAFALLILVYAIGGVGAGDVKMQAAFGSWIGAFFGVRPASSLVDLSRDVFGGWIEACFDLQPLSGTLLRGLEGRALGIIWWAFCAGVIAGGIIGLGMMLVRRQFRQNLEHTREILTDLVKGPGEAAKRAQARRSRWHKLPYGIPLCIGFVGYLFYLFYALGQPVP